MLELNDIIEATGGALVSEDAGQFTGISIDSRTIKEGELFVALKGERFDGHNFVEAGLQTGAGALVSRQWFEANAAGFANKTVIVVEDTLQALHDFARSIRRKFKGPVVAVAGSNGKTTTKELISSILGTRLKVLKTEGNLNNHIGMPLSMTKIADDTGVMVLEMGTNRPGDIDLLCRIASPDIGVVTNIGMEHLEGFGSLLGVRAAELEVLPYVGKIILNGDDRFLMGGVPTGFEGRIIKFGIDNKDSEIMAGNIVMTEEGTRFVLCISGESIQVESRLSGRFNIYNSLAACAVSHALGFVLDKIKEGLESSTAVTMRFQVRRHGGVTYLYDVYNANPSSMKASILELARITGNIRETEQAGHMRAVAVLGDMLELGDYSVRAHGEIGAMLARFGVDHFIGVGPLMTKAVLQFCRSGRLGITKDSAEEAGMELAKFVREGDVVLIKGSRGMKMEKVMEIVEKGAGRDAVPASVEGRA